MENIERLTELFKEFPGIGERQAKRFVFFLLGKDSAYLETLSHDIAHIKKEIKRCTSCFRFFQSKNSSICDVCADPKIDKALLMVVEKDSDFENVRRTKAYSGRYFILGGTVPIVEKDTAKRVRISELLEKIKIESKNGLKEVVLAFSMNPHGDHTDTYIREKLSPLSHEFNFKITSLGRGLSTGSELEYSDNDTIKNALKNRQ